MNNKDYNLSNSAIKLKKFSVITFTCIYASIFLYTLNQQLLIPCTIALVVGGILIAIKYWLIKPIMRIKVVIWEIISIVFLTIMFFSHLLNFIPNFIKEVILWATIISFLLIYFKLLYDGKLTEDVN